MAKKGAGKASKAEQLDLEDASLNLTDNQKKMIMNIVTHMIRADQEKEALKDDLEATASNLGVKSGVVQKIARVVYQEQTKGGIVNREKNLLSLAEQVLDGNPGVHDEPT